MHWRRFNSRITHHFASEEDRTPPVDLHCSTMHFSSLTWDVVALGSSALKHVPTEMRSRNESMCWETGSVLGSSASKAEQHIVPSSGHTSRNTKHLATSFSGSCCIAIPVAFPVLDVIALATFRRKVSSFERCLRSVCKICFDLRGPSFLTPLRCRYQSLLASARLRL